MKRLIRSRASSAACSTSANTCSSAVLSVKLQALPSSSYRSLHKQHIRSITHTHKHVERSKVLQRSTAACTLPDDGLFDGLLFGFFGVFRVDWHDLRHRFLRCDVIITQNGSLLREIHVLHKRHAALQS